MLKQALSFGLARLISKPIFLVLDKLVILFLLGCHLIIILEIIGFLIKHHIVRVLDA